MFFNLRSLAHKLYSDLLTHFSKMFDRLKFYFLILDNKFVFGYCKTEKKVRSKLENIYAKKESHLNSHLRVKNK